MMKITLPRLLLLTPGLTVLLSCGPLSAQSSLEPLYPEAQPVRSCESLLDINLPDTTIKSAAIDSNDSNVCRVHAVTTHEPVGDEVNIWVAIPMENWNGRYMGTGGGGFSGGSERGVVQPASQGFAAGATDTGHSGASGSFALSESGGLNWQLIRDNAHVGIHEMTITGQALTQTLYGQAPGKSYFNGCSTGGRQGLMEAQRYPQDYDGIVSGAPAINWHKLHVQQLWGPMLMNNEDNPIANCKLAGVTEAAISACDDIDGVTDGVLDSPRLCGFDPAGLVGTDFGNCGVLTAEDASIISRIWAGPTTADGNFLWHGMPVGTNLTALSGSGGDPLQPQAMFISLDWLRYFLTQDTEFDWTTITPEGYERLWEQSVEQFGAVIGTDNPDLSAFKARGGKAIVWHGLTDPLISAYGTTDYYERVLEDMGGQVETEDFIRLFMAPGVDHCGGGTGPTPSSQLEALIDWVENGTAPEILPAALTSPNGEVIRTRPLCPYPQVAKYSGEGSTDDAENYSCTISY